MVDVPPWEQLNKCPECGADMEREGMVGEQVGLYYRCERHGRYRYSWDDDRLEPLAGPQQAARHDDNDESGR